jgi:hypothetical protein
MKFLFAVVVALGPLTFSSGAEAAQCGPRAKVTEALNRQFQESRQGLGLLGQAAVIELFVSTKGTWTMTSTNTQGLTCVIAAGDAWQAEKKTVIGLNT